MNENKTIYIGNLSYNAEESDLIEFLHPRIAKRITIPTDKETERPRGFAFVEFGSEEEAQGAVKALDGADFLGRTIKVSIAQPRNGGERRGERRDGRRDDRKRDRY